MVFRYLTIIGLTIMLLTVFGCTTNQQRESMLDKNWGRSFETARFNQILNPDAEKKLEPIAGLDGSAALNNMDQYRKGFGKSAPAPVYNINLTGLGGK